MKASELFPSTYLNAKSAGQYNGKTLTIFEVKVEHIPGRDGAEGQDKLALGFEGVEKLMIVNRINYQTLVECFGDETDDWKMKKVVLGIVRIPFNGKPTPSIMLSPAETGQDDTITNDNSKKGRKR